MFLPGGETVVERYGRFRRALPGTCGDLHLDPSVLNFRELTELIVTWLKRHRLEPPMRAG